MSPILKVRTSSHLLSSSTDIVRASGYDSFLQFGKIVDSIQKIRSLKVMDLNAVKKSDKERLVEYSNLLNFLMRSALFCCTIRQYES